MPENLQDKQKKKINWGDLRKVTPVSRNFGYDRGTPVDRYYIEKFLEENKADIRGSVLEIKDRNYTERFGGMKVSFSDILDIDSSNKSATIYADLRDTSTLPKEEYDCIILTQTLHYIDVFDVAIKNLYKMLNKDGILLCTLPSVSRMNYDFGEEGDFWRFTKVSARYIFRRHFTEDKLQIKTYGNVFTNICFLEGVCLEEITREELDYYDKCFPLIVCVRGAK